jgi:hypothetical protein
MATKRITYVGPHDEVEIEHPVAGWLTVARNGEITVGGDLADALLEQPTNWQPAAVETPAKPAKED